MTATAAWKSGRGNCDERVWENRRRGRAYQIMLQHGIGLLAGGVEERPAVFLLASLTATAKIAGQRAGCRAVLYFTLQFLA